MAEQSSTVSVVNSGAPPPPPEGQRDAARAASRAALSNELAEQLFGMDKDETPDGAAKAADETVTGGDDEKTDPSPPPAREEPAADEESEEESPKAEEPPADKDLQKRLAAIQKEEKRAKAALAEERRQAAEDRRAAAEERRQAAKQLADIEQLTKRARYDLPGLLRALGLKDDEFEQVAREVYTASPKGRENPANREAAARTARERERDDELHQTREELAQIRQQLQQRDLQQRIDSWLDGAAKAATDDTPLVKSMISRAPQKARQRIAAVAERLHEESDEIPDYVDVLAELEKERRAELEELGIDAPAAKAAPPKTEPVPPAARTKPAPRSDLRSPGVQQPGSTQPKGYDDRRQQERAELARDFAAGRYDA